MLPNLNTLDDLATKLCIGIPSCTKSKGLGGGRKREHRSVLDQLDRALWSPTLLLVHGHGAAVSNSINRYLRVLVGYYA